MRKHYQTLVLVGFVAIGLSACNTKGESVQDMVGMSRAGPDAFNVVARPPLSVPPEFELRPPAPVGTPGPGEPKMDDVARGLLTGDDASETAVVGVGSTGLDSTGERSLMERFGANKADPTIREKLTTDLYTKKEESSWLNDVIPSLRAQQQKDEIDPIKEAEKLRGDDATKNAVQAPPEAFLKQAEKQQQKRLPSRDAMADENGNPIDASTVKDLRTQAREAATSSKNVAPKAATLPSDLPPPSDAAKE